MIWGIVKAVKINKRYREFFSEEELAGTFAMRFLRGTLRLLLFGVLYTTAGLLFGAAIGFVIDKLFVY